MASARDPRPAGLTDPAVPALGELASLVVAVGARTDPHVAARVDADLDAFPVVAMEARIVRGAAQHAADERQEEAVLPDLVRAGPGGVGVGVIEPVLDERAPV